MEKLGNPAGLDTTLNVLLPPPPISMLSRGTFTDKHFKSNIEIGGKGAVLKIHSFYTRIHSLMFLPNYFVWHRLKFLKQKHRL